jgi:RNA polymerase sigma factor (sigma-70 family)
VTPITERELSLARSMASNYRRRLPPHVPLDEMRAIAYSALVEAASRYQDTHGVPFPFYASQIIAGRMRDYVRKSMRTTLLDDPIPDHLERTLQAPEEDPLRAVFNTQLRSSLEFFLACMPLKFETILRWRFLEGLSQKEIAEKLGLTQSGVSYRLTAALHAMRNLMLALEWEEV